MLTHLFSPRGIPASYRHMEGFGVNTYKMVNAEGADGAGQVPLPPALRRRQPDRGGGRARSRPRISGRRRRTSTRRSSAAITRSGTCSSRSWRTTSIPELDWDPLDDTKIWPEDQFPLRHIGVMTLNRNVADHHNENEQIAMGTGVLVDGLDFSDDKMLVGRTFSYSDTQRYRVGPNYLQLPVNQPKNARVATNQRGGQMSYRVDLAPGQNPHVNYEPSHPQRAARVAARRSRTIRRRSAARLTRSVIERRNDYVQARARYCTMLDWERDDLVKNLGDLLGQCERDVQERMLWHLLLVHDDYGTRVGKAIRLSAADVRHLEPLPGQVLTGGGSGAGSRSSGSNGDRIDADEVGQVDRVGRRTSARPPSRCLAACGKCPRRRSSPGSDRGPRSERFAARSVRLLLRRRAGRSRRRRCSCRRWPCRRQGLDDTRR